LSEEILNILAGIPNLKVIGRTSSFQFKGRNDDLRSIGEKLGASYVLEGSVRRSADRVRITAQLISAHDGGHLWSSTYDRPFGDVLELQDELAAGVARALEVSVRNDAAQARGSRNSEAYDFYLRGLHSLEPFTREAFESGANYFQQALDLDPNFGQAAAELGRMQVLEAEFGFAPSAPTYDRARRTLEMAIRLEPTSSDTQLADLIRQYQNDDAIEVADVFASRGELDDAFRWIDRAYRQRDAGIYFIKVDPLLKNLETDPRYKAFLRKMNLPE
jgi:adenylate cyclase